MRRAGTFVVVVFVAEVFVVVGLVIVVPVVRAMYKKGAQRAKVKHAHPKTPSRSAPATTNGFIALETISHGQIF